MKNELYEAMKQCPGSGSGTVRDWNFVLDSNYPEELFVELMNDGLLKRYAVFSNPIYCYELIHI